MRTKNGVFMQKPTHYSETIASTKWTQVIKATGMNGKNIFEDWTVKKNMFLILSSNPLPMNLSILLADRTTQAFVHFTSIHCTSNNYPFTHTYWYET